MKYFYKYIWPLLALIFTVSDLVPDNLNDVQKQKKKLVLFAIVLAFCVFILTAGIVTYSQLSSDASVFSVVADTEKVSVSQFSDQPFPSWYIPEATLYPDCGSASSKVSGYVDVSKGTEIEFAISQNNLLEIFLLNEDENNSGSLRDEYGKVEKLSSCVVLEIDKEQLSQSLIFPIEGVIKVGDVIKEASTSNPILLDGNVHLIDTYFMSEETYHVGPFELVKGDLFEVESQLTQSSGFVYFGQEYGFSVTYRVKAISGFIKRYKTEPIEVRNGLFNRISNDQALLFLWLCVGILYKVCQALIRFNMGLVDDSQRK